MYIQYILDMYIFIFIYIHISCTDISCVNAMQMIHIGIDVIYNTCIDEYLHCTPKMKLCVFFFFRFFGHLSLLLQTVMQLQPSKVCQFEAHRYVRTSTATRMREAHRKACWL